MNSSAPLMSCQNLSVRHNGRAILDAVNLEVAAGEIVTIVGPNGAGKTTLLKSLLGLLKPDSGSVSRQLDLAIGYLPQRVHIDPILPLNVSRLLTLTQRASMTQQREILAQVGIPQLLESPVQALSGGEMQRVLLARALLRRPQLILLDEPTQGVDLGGEVELYQLIAELRDNLGCGILMVSHNLHLVMAATDRVVCLNRHICCAGTPHSVQHHPEYLALFGTRLANDVAIYTHHHDHQHGLSGSIESVTASGAGESEQQHG